MSRDLKAFIVSTLLIVLSVVLQSTALRWIALKGVVPDLALIVLVFTAVRRGSMTAQLSGFAGGLVEDLLSLSPLGFHAFFRTVVGFFYGLTSGNIFVDPILMPVILVMIATVVKGLIASLLVAFLAVPAAGFGVFAGPLWIELGYNAILAPFLFGLLGLVKPLRSREKERP